LDPFAVKSLPSEDQLYSWKKDINSNVKMTWRYIETFAGRLDNDCVNVLLKLHTAKKIQAAVEQEVIWSSKSYNKATNSIPTSTTFLGCRVSGNAVL
jgi:hypothetical protein